MRLLLILIAAAALTVVLSPSARGAALRRMFGEEHGIRLPRRLQEYADRPLPPAYAGPKHYTYKKGIRQP